MFFLSLTIKWWVYCIPLEKIIIESAHSNQLSESATDIFLKIVLGIYNT